MLSRTGNRIASERQHRPQRLRRRRRRLYVKLSVRRLDALVVEQPPLPEAPSNSCQHRGIGVMPDAEPPLDVPPRARRAVRPTGGSPLLLALGPRQTLRSRSFYPSSSAGVAAVRAVLALPRPRRGERGRPGPPAARCWGRSQRQLRADRWTGRRLLRRRLVATCRESDRSSASWLNIGSGGMGLVVDRSDMQVARQQARFSWMRCRPCARTSRRRSPFPARLAPHHGSPRPLFAAWLSGWPTTSLSGTSSVSECLRGSPDGTAAPGRIRRAVA